MKGSLLWQRKVLPNGLRVLLFPKPTANTAQLSIAVEYGSNHESQENAGTAHFIEHMLAGGSTKRIQTSRSIEDLGGIINFYTDREYTMSMVDVLPEKLPQGSSILSQLLFDSSFEQEKFLSEKQIILNELAEVSDDPSVKVDDLLLNCLFKNHPVKRPIGGYPKTIKALTLENLARIHQASYLPENMIVILTGNVSEKNINLIKRDFNYNSKDGFKRSVYQAENNTKKEQVTLKKTGIAQTYISMGARTISSNHPDAPKLDLISVLLGGGTSSRLFIELREKNALTYDVNTLHSKGLDFGYFNVTCAVKQKNTFKAKNLILKSLSEIRNERVPSEELEKSKSMILSAVLREIDDAVESPDILTYMEIQFRNENALVNYLETIKSVTCQDIIETANVYLQEDMVSTAILKPR